MPARLPLTKHPRPNVAVDLAVLTVGRSPAFAGDDQQLCAVVLPGVDDRPVLPGRFVRERRTVEQTVEEVLEQKLGLVPSRIHPELLAVFSDPDRDPRGWTMSIAYAVTVPAEEMTGSGGELAPIGADGLLASGVRLDYDHDQILVRAVGRLRDLYERRPDPGALLRPPFTLSRLRQLHETVLGEPLLKDTFNRRMVEHLEPVLEPDGSPAMHRGVGRPAQLYRPATPGEGVDGRWRLPRARRR